MVALRERDRQDKPAGPTLQDYWAFDLAPAGYRRGVPNIVDVEMAAEAVCECGRQGLECHGYYKPGSYRCFWSCDCGRAVEV